MLGLFSKATRKPDALVSCISPMDPTNTADIIIFQRCNTASGARQKVCYVVKEIGVDDPDIVVAMRLGQFNESRVRLMKVEVRNLNLKRSILSNAKKLRNANSEQFRKIYITPDLSYQERMHQTQGRKHASFHFQQGLLEEFKMVDLKKWLNLTVSKAIM